MIGHAHEGKPLMVLTKDTDLTLDEALAGRILQTEVGSTLYGVSVEGTDDRDEMGICVEPPDYVVGLKRFEHLIVRTQPDGARSGPGDLDLTLYSLRKWMKLALAGNPTVLMPLFAPEPNSVMVNSDAGRALRANAHRFVSERAAGSFLGYMTSQRAQLTGERPRKHTNRPELIEKYGYDTKFAYHTIRIGLQGIEFLKTGHITLPIPESSRERLLDLRMGAFDLEVALTWMRAVEVGLVNAAEGVAGQRADHEWADEFLTTLGAGDMTDQNGTYDPDAILSDPNSLQVHRMYAEINVGIRDRGEQWSKCANCGEPYQWTEDWSESTVCSQRCFDEFSASLFE